MDNIPEQSGPFTTSINNINKINTATKKLKRNTKKRKTKNRTYY